MKTPDSRQVLRWDYQRQAWRSMNRMAVDPNDRGPTCYWLARCQECGTQVLLAHGRGSCTECWRHRRRQVIEISRLAHYQVWRAIRSGDLPRLDGSIACVDCGAPAKVYDHREYTKPLIVDPVCLGCNARRGPAREIAHLIIPRSAGLTLPLEPSSADLGQ